MTSTILEAPPATLSAPLQDYARSYLAAQQRSGEALLEAAKWLSLARAEAQHGEWGIFLTATRTSESTARRLLHIHQTSQTDPQFADALRRDWLSVTVAGELAQPSVAPETRQRLLSQQEAPTKADVQREKGNGKSATVADLNHDENCRVALTAMETEIRERTEGAKPNAYFWGQTHPEALEAHQWRRAEGGGYHESRCGKTFQGRPWPPTAVRRCLVCATAAPRLCEVAGCDQESIGKENIAGWAIQRCLAHRDQAIAEQQADETIARLMIPRDLCDRAERLGATIDYTSERADGRLLIIAPVGFGSRQGSWCNAGELTTLCEAWERHTRKAAPADAAAPDWLKVGQLAEALSEIAPHRDQGRALDCWIAIGMRLILGPFDWDHFREMVAAAVEAPRVAPDILDQLIALEAAGQAADPMELAQARQNLGNLVEALDDATYERLAARLSAVEARIKEAV